MIIEDLESAHYKSFELDVRLISCIERKQLRDKEKLLLKKLEVEKAKSDDLLLNILPENIADRFKKGDNLISD